MNIFAQNALGLSQEDETIADALTINPEGTLAEDSVEEAAVGTDVLAGTAVELEELHYKLESDLGEEKVLSTESYGYVVAHFNHIVRKFPGMVKNQSILNVSQEGLADVQDRKELHKQLTLAVEEAKGGFLAGVWKTIKTLFERIIAFIVDSFASRKRTITYLEDLKKKLAGKTDKIEVSHSSMVDVSALLSTVTFVNVAKSVGDAFKNLATLTSDVSKLSVPSKEGIKAGLATVDDSSSWWTTKTITKTAFKYIDSKFFLPIGVELKPQADGTIALTSNHVPTTFVNSKAQFTGEQLHDILDDAIATLHNLETWGDKVKQLKKVVEETFDGAVKETESKLSTKILHKLLKAYWVAEYAKLSSHAFRACRNIGRVAADYIKQSEAAAKKD